MLESATTIAKDKHRVLTYWGVYPNAKKAYNIRGKPCWINTKMALIKQIIMSDHIMP